MKVSISGAGGFIGGYLVKDCLNRGWKVKAFDYKPLSEWYQVHKEANNYDKHFGDLNRKEVTDQVVFEVDRVYNLACLMGGIGFCENNHVLTGLSNRIHQNLIISILELEEKFPHIFYSSSACVYNQNLQSTTEDVQLKESDAIPANPDLLYGWEKLFAEKLYEYLNKESGVPISIARLHNVYGPNGTYDGGKEKAPAAALRKAIEFKNGKTKKINIWGDGSIKRSFMYISDAIEGIQRLVENGYNKPINLGSSEGITIQNLHDMCCKIVNVIPDYEYDLKAPQGVTSRNSDNNLIKSILKWEPTFSLEEGLKKTSIWIEKEILSKS